MTHLLHWWQSDVIYQIYPKSFQDITDDGTGDLCGVVQCLDYLHKLGVDAIRLTPLYVSPRVDNGYDVMGYAAIDFIYGTLNNFDELAAQTKPCGIRAILDMVFSHTSIQHVWFREVLNKENPYRQLHIWRDGESETPPNSRRPKFGNSVWCRYVGSEQYYLHLLAPEQAGLNWGNPAVCAELKRVCELWASHGVNGLCLGVVNLVSKDLRYPEDLDGDGRRFYADEPRVHEFLHEMNRDVFTPCGLMIVGEMSSISLEHCRRYAALTGSELSMTSNFHRLKVDCPGGEKWTLAKPDFAALKTSSHR